MIGNTQNDYFEFNSNSSYIGSLRIPSESTYYLPLQFNWREITNSNSSGSDSKNGVIVIDNPKLFDLAFELRLRDEATMRIVGGYSYFIKGNGSLGPIIGSLSVEYSTDEDLNQHKVHLAANDIQSIQSISWKDENGGILGDSQDITVDGSSESTIDVEIVAENGEKGNLQLTLPMIQKILSARIDESGCLSIELLNNAIENTSIVVSGLNTLASAESFNFPTGRKDAEFRLTDNAMNNGSFIGIKLIVNGEEIDNYKITIK